MADNGKERISNYSRHKLNAIMAMSLAKHLQLATMDLFQVKILPYWEAVCHSTTKL
jgi:hypothetical protein